MHKWSKRIQVPEGPCKLNNSSSALDSDEAGVPNLVEGNGEKMVNITIIALFQTGGLILENLYEV